PEREVVDEERGVDRHVHEGVDPAPPADLEAPEAAERALHPHHVAALLGKCGGELGHRERDRQAPHHRGDHQQQQGQTGTEGADRVLDAVGAAADVEEEDGDEGKEPDLPAPAGTHAIAALIRAGNPWSHSSIGTCLSTMISSLPLGSLRTRPAPVPSGITSASRCTPIASVTAKILLISAMPTASSVTGRCAARREDARRRAGWSGGRPPAWSRSAAGARRAGRWRRARSDREPARRARARASTPGAARPTARPGDPAPPAC